MDTNLPVDSPSRLERAMMRAKPGTRNPNYETYFNR